MAFDKDALRQAFRNPAPLRDADRRAIEYKLGTALPPDLAEVLTAVLGAEPDGTHVTDRPEAESTSIDRFHTAEDILATMELEGFRGRALLPIADDGCGNDIYLNARTGFSVHFRDNDEPRPDLRLADSIDDFLATLKPADEVLPEIPDRLLKGATVTVNPEAEKNIRAFRERLRKSQT